MTIRGSNFNDVTAVMFGAQPADEVAVRDEEVITARAPAASGAVPVTVTTHFGTSALNPADMFTYAGAAMVTEVEPDQGPEAGGTQVVIKGTGLSAEPIEGIAFGGGAFVYTFQMLSEDELTTVSPPGTGTVPVATFGRACASTTSAYFTYIPSPTAAKVESDHGPPSGTTAQTGAADDLTATATIGLLKGALAPLSSQLAPTIPGLLHNNGLSTSVTAPAAGTIEIDWTGAVSVTRPRAAHLAGRAPSKRVLVATGQHGFSAAGTASIKIKLTAAGRRLLRRSKQVKLMATATFTAPGKAAISVTKRFKLRR